jgi:bifunctional non-homologous end joining protein LigD
VKARSRPRAAGPGGETVRELSRLGAPRATVDPATVELMKPRPHERPFSREGWTFELKYDGFRLLAAGGDGTAFLGFKRGRDATATFPEIAGALAALPHRGLILDGEVVVLDEQGRPSFQRLQRRIADGESAGPALLFVFDLLACEGFDLRPLPLRERRALLDRVLAGPPGPLRPTVCVSERGEQLFAAVRELGLEGMVGKRLESPYRGGYSPDWLKVRGDPAGDFAVVGFEPVARSGDGFRNLHLAVRNRAGGWDYVGPVGNGLPGRESAELYPRLDGARRPRPVTPLPRGAGIVPVEPEVVVEVRYREVTAARRLRLPILLRARDDKAAGECCLPGEEPDEAPRASVRSTPPGHFTHLDKVLWPDEGITKGELIEYYRAAAPWMLPFLADRPLVLERYPHGVGDLSFIQKSAPRGLSLRTVTVPSEDGKAHDYVLCDDVEGLLELVNLATIPFHVWSSRAPGLDRPDWCVLDLDPKSAPFAHVATIARALRDLCGEIELPCHVKTSGGSGLHVLLPTGGRLDHEQSRQLAELLARVVVSRLPAIATTARSLRAREGKVYLDVVQNGRGRLLAAPYAVRPKPGGPVSTPLDWSEVQDSLDVRALNLRTLPHRLAGLARDPLLAILDESPDLERSLALLGRRLAE